MATKERELGHSNNPAGAQTTKGSAAGNLPHSIVFKRGTIEKVFTPSKEKIGVKLVKRLHRDWK